MKKIASVFTLMGGLVMAGCTTPAFVDTLDASSAPSGSSAFTQALLDEYKTYTRHEANVEYDWADATIFANKGTMVAQGKSVGPEDLSKWAIPSAHLSELTDARARLMGYLSNGSTERAPAAAAKAQVMFDCWVEEENEGDDENAAACRSQFLAQEPMLQPVMAAAPAPAPVVQPQAPMVVRTFIVYFDFNKSNITSVAKKTLDEVAAAQDEIRPSNIYVSGHTDAVGGSAYNNKLSTKRAQVVVDALAKLGVHSSFFDVRTFGKSRLAVPSSSREPLNRRVEIYFEK